MSILLFPAPLHNQYGKCSKHCWFILTMCIYGRYLGVQTMVQFLTLMLWQPIYEWYFWTWKYNMLAKMHCLCSGGKNKVSMRDHDPWFVPYGYGMDDWVVFWCTMLVVEPKEKLIILLFKVVYYSNNQLHWRICEIKMVPIRITLVKWWWTTRGGRRQTQSSLTPCGC